MLNRVMTETKKEVIPCWIYRSSRKSDMYLYLMKEDDFESVPKPLLDRFGEATLVMEIELHPERNLAREDITKVLANLREHGFHLQVPPNLQPHLYHGE